MNEKLRERLTGGLFEAAGTTLLEMMGYSFILAILAVLCLQVFQNSSRLAAVGGGAVDRIENLAMLEDDFRKSVHESSGVQSNVAGFESNENQLVLRMADGERYTVFGMAEGTKRLCKRTIRVKDGAWDLERAIAYPIDLSAVSFLYSQATPELSRSVILRVTAAGRARDNRVGRNVTVAAAFRGVAAAL
ncbi:MAG: hypothetical protein K1Y02_02405 [Candidatus Hydrogenedentes bacterium]|nr:hypothetical protein [Candidatus Hydrogenedentota bacterium]